MGAKLAAFVITFSIILAAAVVVAAVLLMAMNGYSESDALYGLVAYAVLSLIVSVGSAILSLTVVRLLERRRFGALSGALIAVAAASAAGVVLVTICGIIGVAVAEFVRVNLS